MDKKTRKAVRTYLIKDNKIVVINYKNHDTGYYDIPGGKIEENETPEETSIREFKEETGINIEKQHYIGKTIIEFPDRIFDFNIFIVDEYNGEPLEFDENKSMWIDLNDLYADRDLWGVPGGCQELGESFKDTIIREVKEETNLDIEEKDLELIDIVSGNSRRNSYPNGEVVINNTALYCIRKYSGELKWDEESKEMKFFDLNNLPKNQNDPDLIEIYNEYEKKENQKILKDNIISIN